MQPEQPLGHIDGLTDASSQCLSPHTVLDSQHTLFELCSFRRVRRLRAVGRYCARLLTEGEVRVAGTVRIRHGHVA